MALRKAAQDDRRARRSTLFVALLMAIAAVALVFSPGDAFAGLPRTQAARDQSLVPRHYSRRSTKGDTRQKYLQRRNGDEYTNIPDWVKEYPKMPGSGGHKSWRDYKRQPHKHQARIKSNMWGQGRSIPGAGKGTYEYRRDKMRSLTTDLIKNGRIKTTATRALSLPPFVDRMIQLTKIGTDAAKQEAQEWMFDEKLVENMFESAPERYQNREKDFTRIIPTMPRKGDGANMAYIELV